jgi:protein SCO1/2
LRQTHALIIASEAVMNLKRTLLKTAIAGAVLPVTSVHAAAKLKGPRADYFPNAVLKTHEGKTVRFYNDVMHGDKRVIINMMYGICTNICPPATANLVKVQEMLGDRIGRDIFMYSLTLQPEFDTPEVLHAYREKYGIKPGWTFLTGRRGDMEAIRRKLGFFDRDAVLDSNLSQHTGMLRLGREAHDRWSMMPALLTPKQIVNSVIRL